MPFQTDEELSRSIIYENDSESKNKKRGDFSITSELWNAFLEDHAEALSDDDKVQIKKETREIWKRYKGDRVTLTNTNSVKVRKVYFYHCTMDETGMISIDEYVVGKNNDPDSIEPINDTEFKKIVKQLIVDIKMGTAIPVQSTAGFEGIKWNYISYLALYFDKPNWEFHEDHTAKEIDALHFDEDEIDGVQYQRNKSFYNGGVLDVGKHKVLYCMNFMTDINGNTLKGDDDVNYKFDIYFRVKTKLEDLNRSKKFTIILDPTGTNEGPPLEQ